MNKKLIWLGVAAFAAAFVIWSIRPETPSTVRVRTGKTVSRRIAAASPSVKPAATAAIKPVPKRGAAQMAIVLDDWGNNYNRFPEALAIGRPVTLSILPHLPASQRIARDGHEAGLGIMLHMPMEPIFTQDRLEPHTIKVTTPDPLIARYLDEAVADIPYVEGVNNHMGSRVTSDRRVMDLVLKRLHARGLFFIDSNVSPQTVGEASARAIGIPFAKRQVFIDNDLKADSIAKQLREAIRLALKNGSVVVIGHDKKVTLETIRKMVPEIERNGVRLVLARELVKPLADRGHA